MIKALISICLLMFLVSGCTQSASHTDQIEEIKNSDSTETTPIMETEYEIQELYVQRDEYQIYGEIYIPQNIDQKMPAVI